MSNGMAPIVVVGAGPVGLTTALGLYFYGLPFALFEDDAELSLDTKAGTILTRTLEAFRRYGVADRVLAKALRVDEIGDVERATNTARPSVQTALLSDDTRYPFVINMPQHHLEPILRAAIDERSPGAFHLQHRLTSFRQSDRGVVASFDTPDGAREIEGSYLLACDGILVRQPHLWRFLYPLGAGVPEPSAADFRAKVVRFIGPVDEMEILNTIVYRIHHRVATQWRCDRVFLMGDAAHLITPMWALGLNTGILDAISLPWRLAWVARGWASDALLDGYAREQRPVAAEGSGEMAQAAHRYMAGQAATVKAMSGTAWANAATRTMLGVRLGVDEVGDWSMVKTDRGPFRVGDRIPDGVLHAGDGRPVRLHDLVDDSFVALYFTDVRRRPHIPADAPGLKHRIVSHRDAPLDGGLRERSLFDVGDRFRQLMGCPSDTLVLVRPDDHIAAIAAMRGARAQDLYRQVVGRP